ncbi:MAG: hypothetical protein M1829_006823 [Trizodia sp. TS-e1964]|nr:MAG: hypothetical protein M1829_006823 [Trizodia sp. TS-e1964]
MLNISSLTAAILVVSDTVAQDIDSDQSINYLEPLLKTQGWTSIEHKYVPDDYEKIQMAIVEWAHDEPPINLIITTGGTGFSERDCTPEAIASMIDKPAPGLVFGMLASSYKITPFALLSRPVAGILNKTVIFTLPGSPQGAKENLEAIIKLLPHACLQAAGEDSRTLHAGGVTQLEKEAGISSGNPQNHGQAQPHMHTCLHYRTSASRGEYGPAVSNDPSAGPALRYRASPYPMISATDAMKIVLDNTLIPQSIEISTDSGLTGFILAENVKATESVPAYRASTVDGYAIIHDPETPFVVASFSVVAVSHAKAWQPFRLNPGHIARVTTGAPLPLGTTSVVMIENTVITETTLDKKEELSVKILRDPFPGMNIREIGSEIQLGEIVLHKGDEVSAAGGELGILCSLGVSKVAAYRRPVIGIFSSGNEIVDHQIPGPLSIGEVRDINRPVIISILTKYGYEVVDFSILEDDPSEIEVAIRLAMQRVDVLITTGGVSMGELDLLKPIIERTFGGTIHFGRVNMKPGKPTTFATLPWKNDDGTTKTGYLFCLPGNPAAALVALHVFVLPWLRRSSGMSSAKLPRAFVVLDHAICPDAERQEFHRASVRAGADGFLYASSTGNQRSARVGSLHGANALLFLPAGPAPLAKGERVEAILIGSL